MADLPVQPRLTHYRGGKETLRRKAAEANELAWKIANYVNRLIANNPAENQQIIFATVAIDLNVDTEDVRNALPGGHNGWTFQVNAQNRKDLERYLQDKAL
jgi:predicted transcriptional regulator of viral defense system